ncbi:NADH-quinone oxidoreductase subunit J [Paracoccus sediminis]|uniref:NADH-quinone oxidoreductase subunit J n=1 Tax=Paracoccus sediminis TaxID=1214787 RepID=A0A238WI79_9RHOB|nr:NADH-quinone oxidoreductase subunit J [Paracoccus sediminis]TBN50811.1 NADH-quinone oxidoreductase subunit J [Paracoccus sediminis]SNR46177.1 NADH dehydrogenase subunit J [Paracoccus sediminis]
MIAFAFYLFAVSVCVAGFMVVLSRNPVHSVLWLILAFIASAGLFVLQGAEFVAMLLVIVYVGAVAVLFLFVVMMLDVDFAQLRGELAGYLPLAGMIALVLLALLTVAFGGWEIANEAPDLRAAPIVYQAQNTNALGAILYDRYLLPFQVAGLILLVAMIGAITLTMRHRRDIKRQDVLEQMYRDPAKAMELRDVKPGQGL